MDRRTNQRPSTSSVLRRWTIICVSVTSSLVIVVASYYLIKRFKYPPRSAREELVVLPGAQNTLIMRGPHVVQVTYYLSQTFPAKEALKLLFAELESKGWTSLDYTTYSPTLPSEDWREFGDSTRSPPVMKYTWEGRWKRNGKELMWYEIWFTVPLGGNSKMPEEMTVLGRYDLRGL